ncbi:MAG: hypothetical protein ACLFUU_12925 [Desulfobacteraceae bacterium]
MCNYAGHAYRPSNSTEGELFREEFCYQCQEDDYPFKFCPILSATLICLPGDPDYPEEWIYDLKGIPICTAFHPQY